ncbi:hypothetical protein [Myxococcus qinghaiensis]|uniref:hypothetical protein n=1 Tax=Myxococcus qinghaiensis TaxID=2906758 RepID=UPI0020A8024B|nr:hypothetical protein [Myxococcus qinghaiensis]MCP3164729.1 hypothetical protein [Myxococcus qinghaiensis]
MPKAFKPPERASLHELVRERGLLTESELATLIAGAPIKGSWWGHPAGKDIYFALESLVEDPELLLCKLIEGKRTLVHRRLWPALIRAQREDSLWPTVSPEAKRLLAQVARRGPVQATGKPRLELERALRVVGQPVHTASGAHEVVLVPFESAFPEDALKEAAGLALEDALRALSEAGFSPAAPPVPRKRSKPPPASKQATATARKRTRQPKRTPG